MNPLVELLGLGALTFWIGKRQLELARYVQAVEEDFDKLVMAGWRVPPEWSWPPWADDYDPEFVAAIWEAYSSPTSTDGGS
ncbi:MAG: hypothetical protein IH885_04415 [Myxococcales bacterium]|nr:hypothetical protein [Myxococcales bacterium]